MAKQFLAEVSVYLAANLLTVAMVYGYYMYEKRGDAAPGSAFALWLLSLGALMYGFYAVLA
ncbi:MAG: hypothetical protein D6773_16305 [Alphaproteobacteria bacterium]|nr:MAG: hypothetical protein D6773_16305 [Alphaproteobacteria bacterium]